MQLSERADIIAAILATVGWGDDGVPADRIVKEWLKLRELVWEKLDEEANDLSVLRR